MEEKARKELLELCVEIIESEGRQNVASQLTQAQMLYEKLMILNYLEENEVEMEKQSESESEVVVEEDSVSIEEEDVDEEIEEFLIDVGEEIVVEEEEIVLEDNGEEIEVTEKIVIDNPRTQSLNERLGSNVMQIGLNDRIAFVKHLFDGSQEDLNRVLSQLNTFQNYNEAEDFISSLVKPEYKWSEKEEYEERFMELVRVRFGENLD